MLIGVYIRNDQDVGFGGVCDTDDVKSPRPEQVRNLVADGLANLRAQVLAGRADHLWLTVTCEHVFEAVRNQAVSSGEVCFKCGAVRAD